MAVKRQEVGWGRFKTVFEIFCGYLLLLAVFITVLEIIARVLFNTSVDLFFTLPVWITIWSLLLIIGFLVPSGEHVSIDFIRNRMSGKPRWCLEVLLAMITLGYGIFITWGSLLFIEQLVQKKSVYSGFVTVPQWMVQLSVPIGMIIFTGFAVFNMINAIRKKW